MSNSIPAKPTTVRPPAPPSLAQIRALRAKNERKIETPPKTEPHRSPPETSTVNPIKTEALAKTLVQQAQTKRVNASSVAPSASPPAPQTVASNSKDKASGATKGPMKVDGSVLLKQLMKKKKEVEAQEEKRDESALLSRKGDHNHVYGEELPDNWEPANETEAHVYDMLGQPDCYGDIDDMPFLFMDRAVPSPKM